MIRHTILMPFARLRFAAILREHMRGQKVEWRPLLDGNILIAESDGKETRVERYLSNTDLHPAGRDAEWIKPWRCESKAEYNVGHWVCDKFLDAMVEQDETLNKQIGALGPNFYSKDHYVTFATDDCLWSDQGL